MERRNEKLRQGLKEDTLNKRKIFSALIIILCTVALCTLILTARDSDRLSYWRAALSYYGTTGSEVTNIQVKLYQWGYYGGPVDGLYGYDTFKAVEYFQTKNGLAVDGIAGPETLAALGLAAPPDSSSSSDVSASRDQDLLAHLINGEARGESYVGQVAVGAVIINRTRDSRFPKTIAGVIYQPGAFDAVSDGQINLDPSSSCISAARDALNGWDPSGGAIYYFNPATATSSWIWSRPITTVIGHHDFAK